MMRLQRWNLVVTGLGLLLSGPCADADGVFFPTREDWLRHRERALINEPAQKAVIYFRNGVEDLFISPSFQGNARDFAWVVPVPSRPKVDVVQGALFHELAAIAEPKHPGMRTGGKGAEVAGAVRVVEEKEVGAYRVAVLESTDGKALVKWLNRNGYHMHPRAEEPVRQYVNEKWTFVASKISHSQRGTGLRTGTLAPLRLTFSARAPIYPMRLSGGNPAPFDVLVYLLFPLEDRVADNRGSLPLQNNSIMGRNRIGTLAADPRGRRQHPTLARLFPGGAQIYMTRTYARPLDKLSLQDLVWKPSYLVDKKVAAKNPAVRRRGRT